jgi:Trypsin-like peptidase domain
MAVPLISQGPLAREHITLDKASPIPEPVQDLTWHDFGLVVDGVLGGIQDVGRAIHDRPLKATGECLGMAALGVGLGLLQGRAGMLQLGLEVAAGVSTLSFSMDVLARGKSISAALKSVDGKPARDAQARQAIADASGSFFADSLLMAAGGIAGAKLGKPFAGRVNGDLLSVPVLRTGDGLTQGSRTLFARDASEARIFGGARPGMVRISSIVTHDRGKTLSRSSGFFVDEKGTVATALHPIKQAARGGEIEVRTSAGKTFRAYLHASDPANDIALLRFTEGRSVRPGQFSPLPLAESTGNLSAGSTVFGLGYPSPKISSKTLVLSPGEFESSAPLLDANRTESAGNAALRRSQGEDLGRIVLKQEMHIEHAMSGGPMLNDHGQVVGILTSRMLLDNQPVIAKATPVDALQALNRVQR